MAASTHVPFLYARQGATRCILLLARWDGLSGPARTGLQLQSRMSGLSPVPVVLRPSSERQSLAYALPFRTWLQHDRKRLNQDTRPRLDGRMEQSGPAKGWCDPNPEITHSFPLELRLFPVKVEPITAEPRGGLGPCQRADRPPRPR